MGAGIYKFGNNTYLRRVRRRSNLGHFFGEKLRLMGREIWQQICHKDNKNGNNSHRNVVLEICAMG